MEYTVRHEYKHAFDRNDPDAKRAQELRKELNEVEAKLSAQVKADPAYKAAAKLNNHPTTVSFGPNYLTATVAFSWKPVQHPPVGLSRAEYLDPKLLNNLLNTKLLTDEQKRALLRKAFPATFEEVLSDGKIPGGNAKTEGSAST